jgi:hypothetical protein
VFISLNTINQKTILMTNGVIQQEVSKRRTFAIISHPDAGKTTITEKVLLFGQLIQKAGTVKGKNLASLPHLTGWRWKKSAVFLSRPL